MRIGIICPSEIALRRFMPALQKHSEFQFVGIGVCSYEERFGDSNISNSEADMILETEKNKAKVFIDSYGGKMFSSYKEITESEMIDAIYIPLPPALHYKWAKHALEHGKHVLVEKPSTIRSEDTKELVEIARKNKLALHENYMFMFHEQLDAIEDIVKRGDIGEVRLYRISFGFPQRDKMDFRYNKSLGGGALIDAGGYTMKYADRLLGNTASVKYAQINNLEGFEVDMYGSGAMINDDGVTAQIAFGMDNNYKCELEIWGSKGTIRTDRILTAPVDFVPKVVVRNGNEDKVYDLPSDDAFFKSIQYFQSCMENEDTRIKSYNAMIRQAELVDEFRRLSGV